MSTSRDGTSIDDTSIDDRFLAAHQTSAALHQEAGTLFPSGVTHDIRYFEPFPVYVERAQGARKWDVDGN
ncbi:MAG: aspartate aminotransferase family protein, partial [Dehalococcoidia bacterium]